MREDSPSRKLPGTKTTMRQRRGCNLIYTGYIHTGPLYQIPYVYSQCGDHTIPI